MLGLAVYVFTLAATFGIVGLTPVMLLESLLHRNRRYGAIAAAVLAGFVVGGLAAWGLLRPSDWPLPLWQTMRASVDAATYGHPVEHAAEQLLLFMMFIGDLLAITCGWLVYRGMHSDSK